MPRRSESPRRFQLGIFVALKEAVVIPVVLTSPGFLGAWIRPKFDEPIIDLVVSGIAFSLLTLPGLAIARVRLRRIE